ncbi:nitrate- and nitrite sensing domain-containing protein [Nocardia salmonicida]|uniref:sensor histidine kinase n=1 Tax=Nocardia salmonicida TaxID=53431 RepID=UPI0037123226
MAVWTKCPIGPGQLGGKTARGLSALVPDSHAGDRILMVITRRTLRGLLAWRPESTAATGKFGVRASLIAIVLVPSLALLAVGVGAAAYLVAAGRDARQWAELASGTTGPAVQMVQAFQEERRLSVLHIAGEPTGGGSLIAARQRSNGALGEVKTKGQDAARMRADFATDIAGYDKLYALLPDLRAQIDSRKLPVEAVVATFGSIVDVIVAASVLAARAAPSSDVSIELFKGVAVLRASEALSRANALATVADTMTGEQFIEFSAEVGEQRSEIAFATAILQDQQLGELQAIVTGPSWALLTRHQQETLLAGPAESTPGGRSGARSTAATVRAEVQAASVQVGSELAELWEAQSRRAQAIAVRDADRTARDSLLGGLAVLAAAVLGFLAVVLVANRLIGRMRQLRAQTLALSDEHLPEAMRRLEAGEKLDMDAELHRLQFGTDEIGQVADAFNRAHSAAVTAAVAEAKLRTGVNTVFVNMAQRSQSIVQKQLELLDPAEQGEQDPARLDLLFRLDHLATRARRNAENLIILGGGQPGRRWRNPVPLNDIARGSVAESLDYRRIAVHRLPQVYVVGAVVADLIHVLAELMDNATAFSRRQTEVEVTGRIVGNGAVLEIIDQGSGMTDDELTARNALLAEPASFSLETLAENGRLGLFVIASLAARHQISVQLKESAYGGIHALVLIPSRYLTNEQDSAERSARHAMAPLPTAPPTPPSIPVATFGLNGPPGSAHPPFGDTRNGQ